MAAWRPHAAKEDFDHAELVMHAAEGVPRAEEIVGPDQGVPLLVEQVDQLIKLAG